MDKTIRVPDPVDLTEHRINVGDTTQFIAKFNRTQGDLEQFSGQLGGFSEDVARIAEGIEAEASRTEMYSRNLLQPVFSDLYGAASFFDNAGKVTVSGTEYAVTPGSAVVGGLQVQIPAATLAAAEGDFIQCSVAWDVDAAGVFSVTVNLFADPVEQVSQETLFYVTLARIDAGQVVTDRRQVMRRAEQLQQDVKLLELGLVGAVQAFAREAPPTGWLKANGAAVSRSAYADLFAAIGTRFGAGDGSTTFNLPDLRAEFIRGVDDGRGIDAGRGFGSAQDSENKSHNHTASSGSAGSHNHTASTGNAGHHAHSGSTNTAGNHSHSTSLAKGAYTDNREGAGGLPGLNDTKSWGTSTNGAHSHSVNINGNGAHIHSVTVNSGGKHSHTVTVNSSGGAESRPRNIALLYCIKY